MSKILILNTGGTIGMTRTDKGYMPDRAYFRKALLSMDSLRAPGMPSWDLVETEELLDSSNMTVRDWNEIAGLLAKYYDASTDSSCCMARIPWRIPRRRFRSCWKAWISPSS